VEKQKESTYQNFRTHVTFDMLKEAAQPLHELLCKYGDPHTSIVITQSSVKVVQDEIGMPLPVPD